MTNFETRGVASVSHRRTLTYLVAKNPSPAALGDVSTYAVVLTAISRRRSVTYAHANLLSLQ